MGLRDAVIELVEELLSASEAEKHFDTMLARRALDGLIELTIQASMELASIYSHSKIGTFSRYNPGYLIVTWHSPVRERVVFSKLSSRRPTAGKAPSAQNQNQGRLLD